MKRVSYEDISLAETTLRDVPAKYVEAVRTQKHTEMTAFLKTEILHVIFITFLTQKDGTWLWNYTRKGPLTVKLEKSAYDHNIDGLT
jgi:hypothetical protein